MAISLLLGSTGVLNANSAPSAQQATTLIAQAISVRKFAGARVHDVLLSEPEKKDGLYLYRGEFNVAKTGKKVSCEDWSFTLRQKAGSWGVVEIVRGRCND